MQGLPLRRIVMPHLLLRCLLLCCLVLLAGCPKSASKGTALEQVQYDYSAAIRWGDFEGAWNLVDAETRKQHPLTEAKKRFNHKMSSIGPRSYRRLISPGRSGLRPGARSACSRSHAGGRPRSQPR